jgi:hypothetical protein
VDEDTIAFKALKEKAIEGLIWKKKQNSQEYIDRLRHELEVVKHLKFSKYFLTYSKIMNLVSETQILGLARGSAAGSLLAYVLNITQVDPIKHKLLFQRFLVKSKAGFPDIDSDVSDRDSALEVITNSLVNRTSFQFLILHNSKCALSSKTYVNLREFHLKKLMLSQKTSNVKLEKKPEKLLGLTQLCGF